MKSIRLAGAPWHDKASGVRLVPWEGQGKVAFGADGIRISAQRSGCLAGVLLKTGNLHPRHMYNFLLTASAVPDGAMLTVLIGDPKRLAYRICLTGKEREVQFALDGALARDAFIGLTTLGENPPASMRITGLRAIDLGALPYAPRRGMLVRHLPRLADSARQRIRTLVQRLRMISYRRLHRWGLFGSGVKIGEGCGIFGTDGIFLNDHASIGPGNYINAEICGRIIFGKGAHMSPGCFVVTRSLISIGEEALIGPNAVIWGGNHVFAARNRPISAQGNEHRPIIIGDWCWLGANVTVLPGVTIGKGAVIGAGAVVTKDIPPYSVAAGVPARVIRKR